MRLSIVVPLYNEKDNVSPLHQAVVNAMESADVAFQLVLVNDGSRDGTDAELDRVAATDKRVTVVHLRRNFGQSAALAAGIDHATGDCVATMDGDLQNDPADLPIMLQKLIDEDLDVVLGWRQKRQDRWLDRKLPSLIANRMIGHLTGIRVKDLGCTIRVMRAEIARDLCLVGEMHRFMSVLSQADGARVVEIPVKHHARQHGESKYGMSRVGRVILDLITVLYITRFANRPMRLFGPVGLACFTSGGITGMLACIYLVMGWTKPLDPSSWATICVVGCVSGLNFLAAGVLAESSVRSRLDSGQRPYKVRRVSGAEEPTLAMDRKRAA